MGRSRMLKAVVAAALFAALAVWATRPGGPPPPAGEGEEAILTRAQERYDAGDRPGALALGREAVRRFPDSAHARVRVGVWLVGRPEWEPAADAVSPEAAAEAQEGERFLREAAALAPGRPEAPLQMAMLLRHRGDPEAGAWLDRVAAIDPSDPSLLKIHALLRFERWVQQAASLLSSAGELPAHGTLDAVWAQATDPAGELAAAEALAARASQADPRDRTARDLLASCAYHRAETLYAVAQYLAKWGEVGPGMAAAPADLARRNGEAADAYARAESLGVPPQTFWRKWCDALHAAGRIDDAVRCYARAVRDPGPDQAELTGRFYDLLRIHANRAFIAGDRDRARVWYRMCLDVLPPDVSGAPIRAHLDLIREEDVREALELASYYAESFGSTEAADALAAGLERAPGDVRLLRARADHLARGSDREALREALRAWSDAAPDDYEPCRRMGDLHAAEGEWPLACRAYEGAIERMPPREEWRQIEERLAEARTRVQGP